MAGGMKSLAKDTAIYGLSSILGKMLNWLLTPLFAYTLATPGEYGIMSYIYAYTAMVVVILTFGMETGLFRFANKKDEYDPLTVYSTTLIGVGTVVALFFITITIFIRPVTDLIAESTTKYQIYPSYVFMMLLVLCMDSFSCIPFAFLRFKQRPIKFAALKMLYIILYIIFCLFFLVVCPYMHKHSPGLIAWFYDPGYQVGYIFVSNLLATFIQTCFLLTELTGFKYRFNKPLFKKMLHYSLPLLVLGIAGMMSQTIDKLIFPWRYAGEGDSFDQLGVYTACFKLGVIMIMFIQAFRYAYEPFIFSKQSGADNTKAYASAMKYFIIFGLFIFLGVCFYIDIIKFFFPPVYYEGLPVVPIILLGELFFGIFFNLSVWYKLTNKTKWGAVFSIIGCIIIVLFNIIFIPYWGYMACAWASFTGYLTIMLISYFMGQKIYPVEYDLRSFFLYFGLAMLLYAISVYVEIDNLVLRLVFRTFLLCIYIAVMLKKDIHLKEMP